MSVVKELFRIPAAIGMPAPDARIFYTVDNGNGFVVIGFDRQPSPLLIPSFAFLATNQFIDYPILEFYLAALSFHDDCFFS